MSKAGKKEITKIMIMEHPISVSTTPTKENILLIVKRMPRTAQQAPLMNMSQSLAELKESQSDFPVTILYFSSMQWVGYCYHLSRQILEEKFYSGEPKPENATVGMFHSSMEPDPGKVN